MTVAAAETVAQPRPKFVDKTWIRQQLAKIDAETGFVPVPEATPEMAQRMTAESMRARGVDPDTLYFPQDDEE